MTRKDYELIAAELRVASEEAYQEIRNFHEARDAVRHVALRLADALTTTNPRFDRQRFLTACGF